MLANVPLGIGLVQILLALAAIPAYLAYDGGSVAKLLSFSP